MSVTTVAGSFITVNTIDSDHYVDGSIDTVHLGANQIDGTKLAIASQAAGDIMYYNGTDWIRLAKGTADQVLTMNDGATAPNWETASAGTAVAGTTDNGMLTFVNSGSTFAAESTLTYDASANTNMLELTNLEAATNKHARIKMRVATGSGDPVVEWSVADSNVWSLGIDNTDSDNLYLMKDSQPGQVAGNIVMKMDRDGAVTMPNQPTVLYRATAQHANVTGDGTAYTLTNFAEILDYNDDFDGQTFTAPVTGVYLVTARVNLLGLAADHNDGRMWINSSNGEYGNNEMLIGVIRGANNQAQFQIAALVDMDADDTFTIIVDILGGSKSVDINGGTSTSRASFISATLLH